MTKALELGQTVVTLLWGAKKYHVFDQSLYSPMVTLWKTQHYVIRGHFVIFVGQCHILYFISSIT